MIYRFIYVKFLRSLFILKHNLYDKYYYESYALLTLKHFWKDFKEGFCNSDRPDLQNDKENIGVEVVQALSEYEGMCRSIENNNYGVSLPKEYFECVNRLDKCNNVNRDRYHINEIINAVDEKLHKLNKHEDGYTLFKTNGLYVYAENSLLELDDIKDLQLIIRDIQSGFEICFDLIFINAIEKMFIINRNNIIEQCDFDKEKLENIHKEALITSEILRIEMAEK